MIDKINTFKWNTPVLLIILLDFFNIWIPRFCYHKKLSSSGNCRMCLVEVKGSLKPLIACCTLYNKNMLVYTNTDLVRRSREFIMEFLLINHPLDCPICDQAGECDLQDLSLIYGSDDSRFKYKKKAILNKNVGGLIKTNMNRCIYCTRCVRYTSELNNIYTFNTLGRGGYSEISNYIDSYNYSNYVDGNVIDLCPVGALTSKPYLFRNRTWELSSVESIDILDSLCSHIRIDTINNTIERILPKPNNNINEEWITDKIRFCYDGFKKQRLSYPSYKVNAALWSTQNVDKMIFISSSWFLVLLKISTTFLVHNNLNLNNNFFHIITGHLVDLFSLYIIKYFSSVLGFNNMNLNINKNIDLRKHYLFNVNVNVIDLNNLFIFIGVNPKSDSPIINLKIKNIKHRYNNKIHLYYIGNKVLFNYQCIHLGICMNTLVKILCGKFFLCKIMENLKNTVFFFSVFINKVDNYLEFLEYSSFTTQKKNFIVNYMSLFSSDVCLYELGVSSYYYSKSMFIHNNDAKILYLVGADFNNFYINNNVFVIYQGHHGNIGVKHANIVLPTNTFVENTSFFINCEGRLFVSNLAVTKKKKMVNNETILYNLFDLFYYDKKLKKKLLSLFVLFFYKIPFFFTKYKYSYKLFLSLLNFVNIISFYPSINTSFYNNHDYYNSDVISKSSYYIYKLKWQLFNF